MNSVTPLFLAGMIFLLLTCKESNDNKPITINKADSSGILQNQQVPIKKDEGIEYDEKADSLHMVGILNEALEIAYQNIKAESFTKKFETASDSTYAVTVNLEMDNLFSPKYKHLIIRRRNPINVYTDIYVIKGVKFDQVVSYRQWAIEYVTDTLQDVNGDGTQDFLGNWYGSTGCCLKNFYDVYLFQPGNGSFSTKYKFINPTFSSKEKVIRGVKYGHPGETSMYKYKWNGLKVDTIEYIYYEKHNNGIKTGKVIKEKYSLKNEKDETSERLNRAPIEYRKIYGYDWFTGNI